MWNIPAGQGKSRIGITATLIALFQNETSTVHHLYNELERMEID